MLQHETAEFSGGSEQQRLAVVTADVNVQKYLGDFITDEVAISSYIAARSVPGRDIPTTAIDRSTRRQYSFQMRGRVLGEASNNQITLFVPEIVQQTQQRKYFTPEEWLLSSKEWQSLSPLERMNRALLHELEHVIHSRELDWSFALSTIGKRFAMERMKRRSHLGGAVASATLLYGSGYLAQRGIIPEGATDLASLSLLGVAHAQKTIARNAMRRIYMTSPHEVRANAASLQTDQQFFKLAA